MAPDISTLLKHLAVPGFRYRDAHAPPARRAHERSARAGVAIFALVSLVRGVGRTTLAANLATVLGRRGLRAAAVDLDPRGDLRSHFAARLTAPTQAPRAALAPEIFWPERSVGFVPHLQDHASAVEAAWDCDAVVLDTAAGVSDAVEQALAEADEVLIVCRPNPACLDAVKDTEALLARCRMRSWRRTRARYLVNRFDGRRPADRAALGVLRGLLGARLISPAVQDDSAVPAALAAGLSIEDAAEGSQAVADLRSLAQELVP
jgi:cellulose synthase operon protein YhjQ